MPFTVYSTYYDVDVFFFLFFVYTLAVPGNISMSCMSEIKEMQTAVYLAI